MAQVNAGRVRFVGRGEYNNSTQYYTFDLVNYNGNSYFAKSDTLGNLPTDTTHWQLVAEKGNVGSTGPTGNGIASITKTSTSGLVDTYTITFTDGNTTTFNVENGNGIDHISLTSQSGATKVYTIYYTDGTTSEYTVQDGEVTQEVFDEEIERANMIYNAMPKVSGEGTDLTLDNTAECPVYDIELSPSELEQATTTGKNIALPTWAEDFVSAVNDNTRAKLETKDSRNCLWYIPQAGYNYYPTMNFTLGTTFKENTQYTVSFDILKQTSTSRTVGIHYTDGTWTSNQSVSSLDTWEHQSVTSTAGKTIDYICPYYTSGNTYIDTNTWQIEEGTTETSYEKPTYGASPNPQYPQEIHTVSGDNTVVVGNKNLLEPKFQTNTKNGITCSITNEGWLLNGTITSGVSINFVIFEKELSAGTYIINGLPNSTGSTYQGEIDINNSLYRYIKTTNVSINLTEPSTVKILLYCYSAYGTFNNLLLPYQLEKGSTSSTYVPHKSQSLPLSLGDLEYCKIGDYEDLFFKNVVGSEYYDSTLVEDKWYLKKNIRKVVYEGTTMIDVSIDGITHKGLYRSNYPEGKITTGTNGAFYERAKYIRNASQRAENTFYENPTNYLIIGSPTDTLDTLKNKFNGGLFYYPLATPTYTLLSDTLQTQLDNIQKAITYQDQTNVSQTNDDLPFVIKMSAIRDLSGIFELIQ